VEGSLRRGRGVKSWLSSFDRDSAKQDQDGCLKHQRSDSRSVRVGISFISVSKSEFSSRWRRVLYLSTRVDLVNPGCLVIRENKATENRNDILEAFSSSSSLTLFLCLDLPRPSFIRDTRGLAESTSLRSILFLRATRGFCGVSSLRA
jgi:hypothetical protein